MTEGPIKVILSYKEIDKNHLWLRPRRRHPGFDLLIYGANGWEPFGFTHHHHDLCQEEHCHECIPMTEIEQPDNMK